MRASTALAIDHADTRDAATNAARRRILSGNRHYPHGGVFTDLPDDTVWQWVSLRRDELLEVRFINWSYWLDVTAGTRRPVDAIPRIGHGLRVLVGEITAGRLPPPLILVGRPGEHDLVVLEGHNRLTGMVMAAAHLPADVTVLLGTATSMDK